MKSKPAHTLDPEVANKPIAPELPEDLLKTRRNLLLVSFVVIFAVIAKVSVNTNTISLLGLHFNGITNGKLYFALLIINCYLLSHFSLRAYEYSQAQRLLSTSDMGFYQPTYIIGNDIIKESPYPDPSQYTLSGWWSRTTLEFHGLIKEGERIHGEMKEFEIKNTGSSTRNLDVNLGEKIERLTRELLNLSNRQETLYQSASANKLLTALKDFDSSLLRFLHYQKRRVLYIDFLLPIITGTAASLLLVIQLTSLLNSLMP